MEFDLHFLLWERQEREGGSRDRVDPRTVESISGNPMSILRSPGRTTLAPGISRTKRNAPEKVLLQKMFHIHACMQTILGGKCLRI